MFFLNFFIYSSKVRSLNTLNSQYLKNQIDSKAKKSSKMNDTEFAYNQGLLQKIKSCEKDI